MIVVTDETQYLKSLIEQKQYSLDHNSNVIKLIENIPDKTQYWFAMDSNKLIRMIHNKYFKDMEVSGNYHAAVKRIKRVAFCITLDSTMQASAVLSCWGDKSAYFISSGLKSAIAMNVFSHENYSLGEILEKAEINQNSKQITLTATLDKKDIDEVEKVVNNNLFMINFN
jgi:hypothetical protein